MCTAPKMPAPVQSGPSTSTGPGGADGAVTPPPTPMPPPMPAAPGAAALLPPPMAVNANDADNPGLRKKTSKRKQLQQASRGTDPLKIPLDKAKSGVNTQSPSGSRPLNIPTA